MANDSQNSASEMAKIVDDGGHEVKGETADEPSSKPIHVIREPVRDEQVLNAVKFLSHPKVRGSPVIYRRSFLEKKGLTKEEIDEAFRRVPDPPSSVAAVEPTTTNQERKYFEAFTRMLDVQVEEMKSMGNAIRKMEITRRELSEDKGIQEYMQSQSWKGTTNNPWRTNQVKQATSNFNSGSKIIEMIQRGEKPPNIKEIDDNPPNPNQPISKPLLAPKRKPWEVTQQAHQRLSYGLHSQANGQGLNSEIRETNSQPNGSHSNGSDPWWRKKTIKISEVEPESEEQFYDAMRGNASPMKRGWVPPQPPTLLMPEAADAIRQLKPSIQKQQSVDETLTVGSSNGEDLDAKASDSTIEPEMSGSTGMDFSQAKDQEREVSVEIN
ncbi:hypothetical protein C4D60_Mb04t01220 [Musa balbisiana]|uniref:Peroxisomal membrane protein PEX14 n=1 Tax=Musa balbisiana TaxID=52838 RepID=A0A4S8K8U0_MUSBA|nr:hypothetical protein C4D60_Mb04t01220 [Musa balbisiana]